MLPLNLIETRFQNLGEQAVFDGRPYRGLPDRRIEAVELRRRLLDGTVPYLVRDQIWADLIGKIRTAEDTEFLTLMLIGLAMPGLRHAVNRAQFTDRETDRADLESEAVSGFISALHTVGLERPGVCSQLCQTAHTAARALARNAVRLQQSSEAMIRQAAYPAETGHIDLILADAVADGVIDQHEADLIGATRLDGAYLTAIARRENRTPISVGVQRRRAEDRLRAWLAS